MSKIESFAMARFSSLSTVSSCLRCSVFTAILINSKKAFKVMCSLRTSFYAKIKKKRNKRYEIA